MKSGLDKILNQLDNRDWFQKDLAKVFEKKKRPVKLINYFYASWAGECPRLIQYMMNGLVHDDIDQQSQRRLDNGTYMHKRYGDYFEDIGILKAREPAFRQTMEGVFVSGRGDLIIPDDKELNILIELKSINSKGFKEIISSYREKDFLQWNLCAKALQFSTGIILYENKDNQDIKYHFVNFNEDKYFQTIKMFKDIDDCNKRGVIVPKPEICINPKYCLGRKLCSEK